jgi:hypothetical protein
VVGDGVRTVVTASVLEVEARCEGSRLDDDRRRAPGLLPEMAITSSRDRIAVASANRCWYNVAMEAFAIPDARDRVTEAVDALVDESIDGVSTHALGEDLIDIRRAAC